MRWRIRRNYLHRVDAVGEQAGVKGICLFGEIVFLLPLAIVLMLVAVPYVERSWSIFEGSPQPSGLPFVYMLKTFIPLFAVLLGLQGLAQAIRAVLRLSGSSRPVSR